jgi:hypothetical protein
MIPDIPTGKTRELEIRAQYAGSGKLLKDVRVIKADFTLTTSG